MARTREQFIAVCQGLQINGRSGEQTLGEFVTLIGYTLADRTFLISQEWIDAKAEALRTLNIPDAVKMGTVEFLAHTLGVHQQCLHEFPAPQNSTDVRLCARTTGDTLFTDSGSWATIFDIVCNKYWELRSRPEAKGQNTQKILEHYVFG
jgi:hypothetical protein